MANSLGRSVSRERQARRAWRPSCTCASTATKWWRPTSPSAAKTWRRAYSGRTSPTTARRPKCCAASTPSSTWRISPHRAVHPRGHVQRQHLDELQHLPRGRRPRPLRGGVGVERDHARPAVRPRRRAVARRAWRTPATPRSTRTTSRYPSTTYALSKVASETLAEQISRWSGIPFVGLRISNIMEPHDYRRFPSYWPDPHARKWNLWGYVDVRDVAAACRLGLEADVTGSQNVIIAAADTVMNRPSRDLLAEVFPGVPLNRRGRRVRLAAGHRPRQAGCSATSPATPGATKSSAVRSSRYVRPSGNVGRWRAATFPDISAFRTGADRAEA